MDIKDISLQCKDMDLPPFSTAPTPLHPSRALYPGTHTPPPPAQQSPQPQPQPRPAQPPQYVEELPTEPVRLIPNRRAPSPMPNYNETYTRQPKPAVDNTSRFNNPAMQISKLRPGFRTPIGVCCSVFEGSVFL